MSYLVYRVLQSSLWIFIIFFFFNTGAVAVEPTYKQGETIFIETGVETPDRNATWYASMVAKPYAPIFEMLATQGTQGRYYPYTYPVTLKDLVRFHGHDCEGTTHAANAAWVAFKILFPDGIIDRMPNPAISPPESGAIRHPIPGKSPPVIGAKRRWFFSSFS